MIHDLWMRSSRVVRKHVTANATGATVLSPNALTFKEPRNRFQGIDSVSLCILADESIPGLLKRLLIQAQAI